jgi:hypothetical protein
MEEKLRMKKRGLGVVYLYLLAISIRWTQSFLYPLAIYIRWARDFVIRWEMPHRTRLALVDAIDQSTIQLWAEE